MAAKRVYKLVEIRSDNSEIFKETIITDDIDHELFEILSNLNYYTIIDNSLTYGADQAIYQRRYWIYEQIVRQIQIIMEHDLKQMSPKGGYTYE